MKIWNIYVMKTGHEKLFVSIQKCGPENIKLYWWNYYSTTQTDAPLLFCKKNAANSCKCTSYVRLLNNIPLNIFHSLSVSKGNSFVFLRVSMFRKTRKTSRKLFQQIILLPIVYFLVLFPFFLYFIFNTTLENSSL